MTPAQCVVASGNAGKLRELQALLAPFGMQTVAQGELGIKAPPEPHPTFIENALVKARHASQQSGLAAVADDSGICVPALGGDPGVYSARFAERAGAGQGDADNNHHLISRLDALGDKSGKNNAYYVCALVWLAHAEDPLPLIALGLWHGEIIAEPRGSGGFGYDPHFFLPELDCTAAEMTAADKNRISHRGQAMQQLQAQLTARLHDAGGAPGHG